MAAAAELRKSSPGAAEFHPVKSIVRVTAAFAEQQHERIHKKHQAAIEGYNTFYLGRRWYELLKKLGDHKEARRRLLALAKIDFKTWVGETVLKQRVTDYTVNIIQTEDGALGMTDEYGALDLVSMTQAAVQEYIKKGRPAQRFQADEIRTAREITWASNPVAQNKSAAVDVSTWVSKEDPFYNTFSFLYVRRLDRLPNNKIQVKSTQIKSFQTTEHIAQILRELGCQNIPLNISGEQLSSMFFPLPELTSEEAAAHIVAQTKSLPPREQIGSEYDEVVPKNPKHFQEAYAIAERFFTDIVQQYYTHTFVRNDAAQITEEAINFAYRFLVHATTEEIFQNNDPYGALCEGFRIYFRAKYNKEKLSDHEVHAAEVGLGSVWGGFGRMISIADCGINSFNPISFSSPSPIQPGQFYGVTPQMLGKRLKETTEQLCPMCGNCLPLYRTVDGLEICSRCGNWHRLYPGSYNPEQPPTTPLNSSKTKIWPPQHHANPLEPPSSHIQYMDAVVRADINETRGSINAFLSSFFF